MYTSCIICQLQSPGSWQRKELNNTALVHETVLRPPSHLHPGRHDFRMSVCYPFCMRTIRTDEAMPAPPHFPSRQYVRGDSLAPDLGDHGMPTHPSMIFPNCPD